MSRLKAIKVVAFLLMGAALIYFSGCAEDENPVTPSSPIQINILGGPSGEVPFNAYVTYKWQATGGSGNYTSYSYQLSGVDATPQSTLETTKTYYNLTQGAHTFTVTVTDDAGNTADASRSITVGTDAATPVVAITLSPIAGSKVAVGVPVTFAWSAGDPDSYFGAIVDYDYELTRNDTVVVTMTNVKATVASFEGLLAGHHVFTVTARDNAGLTESTAVEFYVVPANIVWMDNQDMGSVYDEFVQQQEWVAALNGFAWEEFDIIDNYTSTSTALANVLEPYINAPGSPINTVIWDDEGVDENYMLYYSTNGVGARAPWLFNFLDRGGNLILIGSNIMDQIYDNVPPTTGQFEVDYMGFMADSTLMEVISDTTFEWVYDSTLQQEVQVRVITFDTTYYDAWMNDTYITLTGDNGYTNITIDVAKDPNTEQASYLFYTLNGTAVKPIMLDDDTGAITGYVVETGHGGKIAALGMNLYYSPTAEIKNVIQKILVDEFGL
jgi:hypothetical protein